MRTPSALLMSGLLAFAPALAAAEQIVIPAGTKIFGELDETVTSNGKRFRVGYEVDGHVWKDVVVGGHRVVPAGTPMKLRISQVDSSNIGGRGGSIEIMAVSVETVDGTEVFLDGGYDRDGGDRYGLTRGLSYLLWPTVFLPGRKAVLEKGTVFDASIPAETPVTLPDSAVPTLDLTGRSDLAVEILYDEIEQGAETLPMQLILCNQGFVQQAEITAVNDKSVRPILVALLSREQREDCYRYGARVNFDTLTKHFSKGINRFSVSMGAATSDVVLNVEM